jgi:hypothetical protein
MYQIKPNELKREPIRIGWLHSDPVYLAVTKGGCSIVLCKNSNKLLGIGNHRAIAKHVARQNEPDIVFDELSKSEELPVETYQNLLPFWTNYTNEVNTKLNG